MKGVSNSCSAFGFVVVVNVVGLINPRYLPLKFFSSKLGRLLLRYCCFGLFVVVVVVSVVVAAVAPADFVNVGDGVDPKSLIKIRSVIDETLFLLLFSCCCYFCYFFFFDLRILNFKFVFPSWFCTKIVRVGC